MFHRSLGVLALAAVAACARDSVSPTAVGSDAHDQTATLKGQYLVLLRDDPGLGDIPTGEGVRASRLPVEAVGVAMARTTSLVASMHGTVRHTYRAALTGFAAQLSDSAAAALRADPAVLSVEPDSYVYGTGVETAAPWSLDRIDQPTRPLDSLYHYGSTGAGVSIYMIDSGILFSNPDFGGRARTGYDAITPGGTAADCNNHGTETASIAGGSTYGVAKGATLYAVRVLDCSLSSTASSVITGIDWVASQKRANPSQPMVANLSLRGTPTAAGDSAVARLVALGVVVTIAAGNSALDACQTWPSRVPTAFTVGGTDTADNMWYQSNVGACIDVLAPSVAVPAAVGPGTMRTAVTGTSASAPLAAGAAAMYLSAHPTATPAQVASALISNATVGQVKNVSGSTPNRLLSVAFMSGGAPANTAPVAKITAPATNTSVAQGTTVTFTGSATDAESGTLSGTSLVWTSSRDGQIGSGTTMSRATLSVGTHTITLAATDPQGARGTASITLTVTSTTTNAAPTATITAPTAGATFAQNASVTFTGSASDPEDGTLSGASLVWTSSIDGQIGTGTSFAKTTLSPGTHTITLTAKDSKGATKTSTRSITVTASTTNRAPVARYTWTCTAAGLSPHQCEFDSSTSTDDAAIVSYRWDWGNGRIETRTAGGIVRNTWAASGTYTVRLTVTDAAGLSSTMSAAVVVP